jgi:hypothetical protein
LNAGKVKELVSTEALKKMGKKKSLQTVESKSFEIDQFSIEKKLCKFKQVHSGDRCDDFKIIFAK